jgi:hypothetical protein
MPVNRSANADSELLAGKCQYRAGLRCPLIAGGSIFDHA